MGLRLVSEPTSWDDYETNFVRVLKRLRDGCWFLDFEVEEAMASRAGARQEQIREGAKTLQP